MRVLIRVAICVSVVSTVFRAPLAAQSVPQVEVGSRVRVMRVGFMEWGPTGTVALVTSDSLAVTSDDDAIGARRLLWSDISRLEVSAGQNRHMLKGMGTGMLIGVVGGAALGYASGDDTCPDEKRQQFFGCILLFSARQKAQVLGVLGGVAVGIGGLVKGASRTEDWLTVDRPSTVAPIVDGRGRIGLSFRF